MLTVQVEKELFEKAFKLVKQHEMTIRQAVEYGLSEFIQAAKALK